MLKGWKSKCAYRDTAGKHSSVTESLNRPEPKRLSYFNVRISEVNKVKPAVVIGTDAGLVLTEYKGVE